MQRSYFREECSVAAGKAAREARLKRAKESLEEAKDLLMQDAAVQFVMNSLYYSFLYTVFGLLEERGLSASSQSEAISSFKREYVLSGIIEKRFLDAVQTAYELRPACDCEGRRKATVGDVEGLLPLADAFLERVERLPSS